MSLEPVSYTHLVGGTKFYDRKEIKDMLSYLKVLVNPSDSIALRRIINVPKRGIGDATIQKVLDFAESYELTLWDALSEVRTKMCIRDSENIGAMLEQRHLSQKIRRGGGKTPNAKKRSYEDDDRLRKNLLYLIKEKNIG